MKKILLISLLLITVTGCSEFAFLMSGGSIAVSQNSYTRMYNAADMLTMMSTKKGIKTHAYEKGKKYVYDQTIKILKQSERKLFRLD
tara:strand:- start:240 stop:500 length:261 start_codon:yes stop_codon:yes gene_type:complete